MVILGIDPGSTRIGYGLVESMGGSLLYHEGGLLSAPQTSVGGERLLAIQRDLDDLLQRTRPERVGIEKLFFSRNRRTALPVAEARGVIVATVLRASIPLVELTPSEVKLSVTGDGQATKEGVAKMVRLLLKLPPQKFIDDVTDAIAIAIAASGSRWK